MTPFSLGKPVVIGGEEVLVVRDVLGSLYNDKASDVFALLEPRSADGRPAIYVSENDLLRLREDYPGVKVYGLWQILFHNRLVEFGSPLVTFPLSERGGLYLLMDLMADLKLPSNIQASGEYINNLIPENYDLDIKTAYVINVDVSTLRLPPQQANTRVEQSEKARSERKRQWMVISSLCGLIVLGAAAANYGMHTIYKSQMAEYATKMKLINELSDRIDVLASERLTERPNDSVAINQVFRLFDLYPDAVTLANAEGLNIGFKGSHNFMTPAKAPVDPALAIPGATSELLPSLAYVVTLNPDEIEADLGDDTGGAFDE